MHSSGRKLRAAWGPAPVPGLPDTSARGRGVSGPRLHSLATTAPGLGRSAVCPIATCAAHHAPAPVHMQPVAVERTRAPCLKPWQPAGSTQSTHHLMMVDWNPNSITRSCECKVAERIRGVHRCGCIRRRPFEKGSGPIAAEALRDATQLARHGAPGTRRRRAAARGRAARSPARPPRQPRRSPWRALLRVAAVGGIQVLLEIKFYLKLLLLLLLSPRANTAPAQRLSAQLAGGDDQGGADAQQHNHEAGPGG